MQNDQSGCKHLHINSNSEIFKTGSTVFDLCILKQYVFKTGMWTKVRAAKHIYSSRKIKLKS